MASKWFSQLRHRRRKSDPPVSPPGPSQDSRRAHELREVFRHLDGDGDGKVSSEELRVFFVSMGDNMSHEEAKVVITDLDSDGDELLDFQDFVRLMERDDAGDSNDDSLRRAFQMFEVDKGSGSITPSGLQQILNRLGDHNSNEECEAMIRIFDLDGNGVVDFHEFQQMMMT